MPRWTRFAGSLLALGVMAAVAAITGVEMPGVDLFSGLTWVLLGGAVILYVATQVIAGRAWHLVLAALGTAMEPMAATGAVMVSQIGKFLPGNVGQFIGRLALCARDGVPVDVAGLALTLELVLTVTAGLAITATGSIFYAATLSRALDKVVPQGGMLLAGLGVLLGGIGVAAATRLLRRWRARRGGAPVIVRPWRLAEPFGLHLANFVLLGLSLLLTFKALPSDAPMVLGLATVIFAVAWIAGLVTPGAPGGLGVREAVIIAALAPFAEPSVAFGAALMHRGVSITGDLATFVLGLAIRRRTGAAATAEAPAAARDMPS